MDQLQAFINKWTGVAADFDHAYGPQCVDLVEFWVTSLGLKPIPGNAKDLYNNADDTQWMKIRNAEDNYPLPGDVLIFDGNMGGGYGHTGIVVTADVNTFDLFDQNDPGLPKVTHFANYMNVIGWLRPLINLITTAIPQEYIDAKAYKDKIIAYNQYYEVPDRVIGDLKNLQPLRDQINQVQSDNAHSLALANKYQQELATVKQTLLNTANSI